MGSLVKVGDIGLAKKIKRRIEPLTTVTDVSADELAAIWQTAPDNRKDMAFLHTVLCQVGFPRDPIKALEYETRYRKAHMLITAGKLYRGEKKGYVQQPVPFGVYVRLLMNLFTTKAVKTGQPRIEIGRSRAEFLQAELGRGDDGTTGKLLLRQLWALMAAVVQLGGEYPNGQVLDVGGRPFYAFEDWLPAVEGQPMLWPGFVQFSADHFNALINGAAVPLDQRHVLWLSKKGNGGALALDIYFWLAARLLYITEPNGVSISWRALKEQFGQGGTNMDTFRKSFKTALRKVLLVYRDAVVREERNGIRLFRSRPPIPPTFAGIARRIEKGL